jgi:hypothetical protein
VLIKAIGKTLKKFETCLDVCFQISVDEKVGVKQSTVENYFSGFFYQKYPTYAIEVINQQSQFIVFRIFPPADILKKHGETLIDYKYSY